MPPRVPRLWTRCIAEGQLPAIASKLRLFVTAIYDEAYSWRVVMPGCGTGYLPSGPA